MSIQHKINETLVEWDSLSKAFRAAAVKAAGAEAAYRHARARFIVEARGLDPKKTVAAAEVEADADDAVYSLHLARLSTAAEADALSKRLTLMRAQADALRSELVDDREASRLYAERAV